MAKTNMALKFQKTSPQFEELKMIQAARLDPRAFGELYLRYVKRVFKYLYSRVGSVQEAEDLTAQTFLAAFESFDRFHQDGHFAPWLFTIARNKAMDHFRRHKKGSFTHEISDVPVEFDPLEGVVQSEQVATLSRLIRTLPEEDRELLRLRFLAEMSFPEMARLLHRQEDAVKKSVYRLLSRLHNQMEVSND